MNSLVPQTIVSNTGKDHRLRLFAKRPTVVAEESDATIPLHVQNPPVAHLSWARADDLMRQGANQCEEAFWHAATAVYRDENAAKAAFLGRNKALDVHSEATLFDNDIQTLLAAKFAIPTHKTPAEFEKAHPNDFAYVKLFAAIETRNNAERRRMISWPRSVNEAEKMIKDNLKARHCEVQFFSAQKVRDKGVKFAYSASLDFKKFFQQFLLLVPRFWAFKYENLVYLLQTIPTGGVLPPLFAQALSKTILAVAIRCAQVEFIVEDDCCIDNLRLCSDHLGALWAAWHELLSLCAHLGITIGELNPPPKLKATPYTYLGMLFTPTDTGPYVELSAKSKTKMLQAIGLLESRCAVLVVDAIAIFGQTVWATTVTNFPLGKLYYVLKFIRRIQTKEMNETIVIWESIIDQWILCLKEMLNIKFEAPLKATSTATMFTDASLSGYGIVILDYGPKPIRIFAGKWSSEEQTLSINQLELKALIIGIRILSRLKPSHDILSLKAQIDNTSARSWALKRRAPTYKANAMTVQLDEELKSSNIILESLDYVNTLRNLADKPSRRFE